jgi:peptide/nickel transport system substrate-binding protein
MEFTANPHYFLGAPKIHRIVVSFVTGESTELLQLQSGLIDWWYQLPTDAVKTAAAIPGVRVVASSENRYVALTFNTARAPFDQIDARRAVAAAIDRARIVTDAAHGTGIPAIADLAPIVFHYPRDLTAHPYDPAAARAYVAKHPMHVTLVYENTTDFGDVALLVQEQLRQVGIDVSLRSIPSQLFYAAPESGGIVRGGKFDLALTTWDSGMDPDNSSIFRCASRPPYGWNLSRYCSAQMERLQDAALAQADPRVRMPVYTSIERLVVADLPQLFLYWPMRYNAITTRLKNFAPNEVVATQNAYQWELSP